MCTRLFIVSCALVPLLALVAMEARANDGVPPEIFELIQDGQDVVVTFGIVEPGGEPGIDSHFNLKRSGPEGDVLVFENEAFDPADGEVRDPWCRIQDSWGENDSDTECATFPDYCEDCDGDDVPECPSSSPDFQAFCAAFLTYKVVDECVPPGLTEYVLATPNDTGGYMTGEGSIDVVDSGESCGPDDSGVDCSVVGVGAGAGGAPPVLLALFMGLVGLVALRLRRNG